MSLNAETCDLCGSDDLFDVVQGVTICWDCESRICGKVLAYQVPFLMAVELVRTELDEALPIAQR